MYNHDRPKTTDAMKANGTSKRAMEDILNQASHGKLVTKAIPKTIRAGSSAAAHGVAVPKVGQRGSSLPVMLGSFSGRVGTHSRGGVRLVTTGHQRCVAHTPYWRRHSPLAQGCQIVTRTIIPAVITWCFDAHYK